MSDMRRLRWLCRRGMKELDLVLGAYLEGYYDSAASSDRKRFRDLLDMADPEIYGLLLGRTQPADDEIRKLIELLRDIRAKA